MRYKSSVLALVVCGGVAVAGAGLATWEKSHATTTEPGQAADGDALERAKAESIHHLKLIMLAFHSYLDANGHFPPSGFSGADREPKLSWRVALLPYLGHQELYQAFRLNEAWDSPHNKTLIGRMPDIFTTPSSPAGPGTTRIRGFEGPGAMFDGNKGLTIPEMTDGTSNTIMIAVTREAVPWTRPGELPVAEGQPDIRPGRRRRQGRAGRRRGRVREVHPARRSGPAEEADYTRGEIRVPRPRRSTRRPATSQVLLQQAPPATATTTDPRPDRAAAPSWPAPPP